MKISALEGFLDFTALVKADDMDFNGCYIGDLLSRVISKAENGGLWVTIMNNMNVPAVAVLAEIPCIILAEGVEPMAGVSEKCSEEGIWLFQSKLGAFEIGWNLKHFMDTENS